MLKEPRVEVVDTQDLPERVRIDGRSGFVRVVDQRT